MTGWIDTHCHLDAPEFDADRDEVLARARDARITRANACRVLPRLAAPTIGSSA